MQADVEFGLPSLASLQAPYLVRYQGAWDCGSRMPSILAVVAEHIARANGRPWSGTPDDLVKLAHEGEQIVRSASHGNHTAKVHVKFPGRRESNYDSPEEFLANLAASDIPQISSVMVLWLESGAALGALHATVDLVRGWRVEPFVTAWSDDQAVADGVARRVAGMFGGRGLWQGLRRDELSRFQRVRARAGVLLVVAVTAAITVAVTIIVTKLLTGH